MKTMIKDKKIKSIYRAAITVFAKNGFDQTTVDEIAEKAKVAKGTIYYYFKSKDEIFFGIIQDGVNQFYELIKNKIKSDLAPKEKLLKLISLEINFFKQYKDFMRVLLSELWRFETHWKKDISTVQEKYTSIIGQIIDEGKTTGVFKKNLNTKITTAATFTFVATLTLDWTYFHPSIKTEDFQNTVQTIFLQGVLN